MRHRPPQESADAQIEPTPTVSEDNADLRATLEPLRIADYEDISVAEFGDKLAQLLDDLALDAAADEYMRFRGDNPDAGDAFDNYFFGVTPIGSWEGNTLTFAGAAVLPAAAPEDRNTQLEYDVILEIRNPEEVTVERVIRSRDECMASMASVGSSVSEVEITDGIVFSNIMNATIADL